MEDPRVPHVSIIVPFLAGSRWIQRCVSAVREAIPESVRHELIIVANGLASEAPSPVSDPATQVLRPEVNFGFGGGCNWGASHARGEYLLFLNDDALVERGWLEALLAVARADPDVGAVGSLVLSPTGVVEEAGRVLWSDGVSDPISGGRTLRDVQLPPMREVDYCSACSLLVRQRAWEEVGGFDERFYPAYYEDSDLCLALRSEGWKVICASRSRVYHEGSASTEPSWRRFLGLHNHRLFAEKWAHVLAEFPARPRAQPSDAQIEQATCGAGGRRAALSAASGGSHVAPPEPATRSPSRSVPPDDVVALARRQVAYLKAELQLKEEYIAYLGATRPEMLRALAHMLRAEQRRASRRDFVRGVPVVGAAAVWIWRRVGQRRRGQP